VENDNISWNYNGYGSSEPFKQIIATQKELINNTISDFFPGKIFKLVWLFFGQKKFFLLIFDGKIPYF